MYLRTWFLIAQMNHAHIPQMISSIQASLTLSSLSFSFEMSLLPEEKMVKYIYKNLEL